MDAWWGRFEVPAEQARRWQIGPLALQVGRRVLEWRVAWSWGADPLDERVEISPAVPVDASLDLATEGSSTVHRFAVHGASSVTLSPMLADRPIVVRPEVPFHLPGGSEARVYVSTPLWVRVEVGGTPLVEVPTFRLKDTWFGPSTRMGELCYASRTSARLTIESVPRRRTRARTEMRIANRGTSLVVLERLKVPMPSLGLYGSASEDLTTDSVEVTRTVTGDTEVDLGEPGTRAGPKLAAPRVSEPLRVLARALGAFIS